MLVINAHPLLDRRAANSWHLESRSITGGTNLLGDEQVIAAPVARWRAEIRLGLLSVSQRAELAAYLSRLRGRVNALRLRPACCAPAALFSRLGAVPPSPVLRAAGLPHADGARFSDGAGYALRLPPMALAAAAPALAGELMLDARGYARGLIVGDWLGLGGRLHRVVQVWPGEAVYRVAIEPRLRLSLAAGAEVDLEPSAVMQLTTDQGGFVGVDYAGQPAVSLSFVEKPGIV